MSKYDSLYNYLRKCDSLVTLSFNEIERIIGCELPLSAKKYEWWWTNEDVDTTRHVHCKSWQNAGYKQVYVDFNKGYVTFERVNH